MNDLWDIGFDQQASQKGLRGLSIAVTREEEIKHNTMCVDRPPEPMPDTISTCRHLVKMPLGTPTGFPVAQVFSEEGSELDAPRAQRFVTDLDAALVEQFLNVPVAQWKAVVALL